MQQYLIKKKGAGFAVGSEVPLNPRQAKYLLATGHITQVKAKPVAKTRLKGAEK